MRDAALLSPEALAETRRLFPAAFGAPPVERVGRWLGWGLFATAVAFSLWWTDFSPARIWAGLAKLGWLVGFMFPPSHGGWLGDFAWGLIETLAIALLGTLAAALLALPLGFLGARSMVASMLVHFSLRRLFDGLRGVDALIWALIFVSVVGLGPFAGVLAIVMSDLGVFAKLFAEAVENIERRQVEGVRATGATAAQVARFGMLPQVLPIFLSSVLYYFESNVRHATILGVVGAGGIGHQLSDRIRINDWNQVSFIIIMILVTVALIDWLSKNVRLRIVGKADYRP
jgi:phosphonate transport system permease protein